MPSFWSPLKTRKYWKQYAIALIFFFVALAFIFLLMQNASLANATVAFGTLILALITAISIINANDQSKRDRKERWINEIIEWAIKLINWRSENKGVFRDISRIRSHKEQRLHKSAHIIELREALAGTHGRNQYAQRIALKISPSLYGPVDRLVKGVEDYIKLLDDWQHAIDTDISLVDDKGYAEKANTAERFIGELADKVIEEAARIKTRGIG